MSDLQFNDLKSRIKTGNEVNSSISSYLIGDSNDETSFSHNKLLLTDRQVSKLCKSFANNSSATAKLLKTQLSKIVQSEGFIGEFPSSLAELVFKAGIKVAKKGLLILANNATKY